MPPSLSPTASAQERRQGNAFLDQGNLQAAINCYQRAAALDPASVDAHISLGYALQQAGQLHAAQASLTQARQLQPQNFDAAYISGQVCVSLRQAAQAVQHFELALVLQPTFESLYGELCQALFESGAMERARNTIDQGLQRYPQNAGFHLFSGNLYFHQKEWDAARLAYDEALRLDPRLPQAYGNLATILQNQERWQEALAYFDKALGLNQRESSFHAGRGRCLFNLGQLENAIQSLLKALSLKPDIAQVHQNLGLIYLQLDRHIESAAHSSKAIALNPSDAKAHNNLGALHLSLGKFLQAEHSFNEACRLEPSSATLHSNLGGSLLRQGQLGPAIACFRTAMALDPLYIESGSNLLFALSADPETLAETYTDQARAFGQHICNVAAPPFSDWPSAHRTDTATPLKVGFVSGHMRNGSIGNFLESVVASVNPLRIQMVAYSTAPKMDELSARIRPRFAEWHQVFGMSSKELAHKIHQDGIHILVDLNGHTDGNSLPVFALKPAPLQVSWLGYWASTGLPTMDFALVDEASLPHSARNQFTETVYSLPHTRLCFTPPKFPLQVSSAPVLRNQFVTFGSYQTLSKIHDGVLSAWARVLQAVPGSRLHLTSHQVSDDAFQQSFRAKLEAAGLDPSRVKLSGPLPREQYLASYAQVDIILDTFPYTGGTTTCEALWMGVPTLTLRGSSMIGRQGVSMLGCVGLHDWIAENEDDYVIKAQAHAADIEALNALRLSLRERALASPLFDAPRFAKDWEDALLAMWQLKQV